MRPDLSRVGASFHGYINQVKEDDLLEAFTRGSTGFLRFLDTIPADKFDYRYAEGKWTIKEVLQHIIDAERVFAYRALRFSRKDTTALHGFDENHFAEQAEASRRSWSDLVEEFNVTRRSSELLFRSFSAEQLEANGISSNAPNYVLALGYIIVGHALHHEKIMRERYL